MKRIIVALTVIALAVSGFSVSAKTLENLQAVQITAQKADINGTNYNLFLSNNTGHYDSETDSVIVYIQNSSKKEMNFQVCVGWAKSTVDTSVDSGFVTLKPGVIGKFVLPNISNYPEKANDAKGYVEGSHLSERSVVRIEVQNCSEKNTFIIFGIQSGQIKNKSLAELASGTVKSIEMPSDAPDSAKLVIKDEEAEDEEEFGWKIEEHPTEEQLTKGIRIIVASAILCVGGLIAYTFAYIVKAYDSKNEKKEKKEKKERKLFRFSRKARKND